MNATPDISIGDKTAVLVEARRLIRPRGRHCRDTYARLMSNRPCEPLHPGAARFCIYGALCRVLGIAGMPCRVDDLYTFSPLLHALAHDLEATAARLVDFEPPELHTINDCGLYVHDILWRGKEAILLLIRETLAGYEKEMVAA